MKRIYTSLFFLLILVNVNGQSTCMETVSFEKWIDNTDSIAVGAGLPKNTFIFPENSSPAIRLLIAFFLSPNQGTTAYTNYWKQVDLGIQRDSSTVKSGKYALKMTVDSDLPASDLLMTQVCKKIPTSITFNYRHVGTGKDTLYFSYFQAKEDDSLPETEEDFKSYPSYAISTIVSQSNDASFKTVTIPVIKNFIDNTADLHSTYMLYYGDEKFLESGAKSAFVIDDIKYNSTPSSIDDDKLDNTKIYPNPVKDLLTITPNSQEIKMISIFDTTGRLIKSLNNESTQIDLSTLPNGFYFLHLLKNNNLTEKIKFVKE
jgi:hypothetical protein